MWKAKKGAPKVGFVLLLCFSLSISACPVRKLNLFPADTGNWSTGDVQLMGGPESCPV